MNSAQLLALAAAFSTAVAGAAQGFNYDANINGRGKTKAEFAAEFTTAAKLDGTNGAFTSARLFTTVQPGSPDAQPIEAIPAALETKTSLLLGLWCSFDKGKASVANEIKALKKATELYCSKGLGDAVVGISVGSEDLYRETQMGNGNGENPGLDPRTLVGYIGEVREAVKGTCLASTKIGHVDTWNAFAEASSKPVIEAVDFLGADEYPYFEYQKPNPIEKGKDLFDAAIKTIKSVAAGKEIWITETGWPLRGKKSGQAVASVENAQRYWREVGCPLFGNTNVWWFALNAAPQNNGESPSFDVLGPQLQTKALFDLSCDNASKSTPTSSSISTSAPSEASQTASPSGAGLDLNAQTGSGSKGGSSGSESNVDSTGSGSQNGSKDDSKQGSQGGSGGSASRDGSGGSGPVVPGSPVNGASGNGTSTRGAQPSGGLPPSSGGRPMSQPVIGGSSQLNSVGAAVLALVLAVVML